MTAATQAKPVLAPTQEEYGAIVNPQPRVPTIDELFDYQVGRLVDAGLVKDRKEFEPLRVHLPEKGLFLVIPGTVPPTKEMMALVDLDGKKGQSWLGDQHITNVVEVPTGPYLALDVEDGRAMLGVSPDNAVPRIKQAARSPYVNAEAQLHAFYFPYVLRNHYLWAAGSRYYETDVLFIWLHYSQPTLFYSPSYRSDPEWGVPSCGRRVGA